MTNLKTSNQTFNLEIYIITQDLIFYGDEILEHLSAADFSKNLNTKFNVYQTDENVFEAELVEVFELRNDEILETFSLIFLLPAEFGIEQRIFKIEHPEMGMMETFIVPIRQVESGIRYEAIFNHLVRKD